MYIISLWTAREALAPLLGIRGVFDRMIPCRQLNPGRFAVVLGAERLIQYGGLLLVQCTSVYLNIISDECVNTALHPAAFSMHIINLSPGFQSTRGSQVDIVPNSQSEIVPWGDGICGVRNVP